MKRNQARIVNKTTNDLNNQVANNNQPKFNIEITLADLIHLTSNGFWYKHEHIATVATYLIYKYGYNYEQQFEVVGGLEQLRVFLNKSESTAVSQGPIFIIYNKGGSHWVTFCITNFENKNVVLYKDSLGEPILDEIKNIIEGCFTDTIFKSHNRKEQIDGCSCGPMSLKNLEIFLHGLKTNETDFIPNFETKKFCSQGEVEQTKQNFKADLQKIHSQKLVKDIVDLVQDKEYDLFKENLIQFLDTCCEYMCVSESMEVYCKVLQEETSKQEKDTNYKIDEKAIEEARRNFLEHVQIKKITEQQTNIAQGTKAEESNDFAPDIKRNFPVHMQKFNEVFGLLTKSERDTKLETALQEVSKVLGIDYDKIKQFFVMKGRKEETKVKQEEVVKPKNIEKIKEDILSCKTNSGPETSRKTLEQLLSELVLDVNEDELSNTSSTGIDPQLSAGELREHYISKYKNSKEILQLEKNFNRVKAHYQEWQDKTVQDILDWARENKTNQLQEKKLYEAIAVMDRANELVTGGDKLRDTQILAVLVFLQSKENKGKLCQISTGEGKTTIVSLLATLSVLQGKKVDVITSNQVLAENGVKNRENFYGLFDISVAANNIDESYGQGPRACYTADIVYGSIGNFQFDYLRDSFEGFETRAKREFSSVILDEVDSMLVDNGGYIAKIAEPFPGIDSLKYVYIKIWQELYKAEHELCKDFEQNLREKTKKLEEKEKTGISEELLQLEYANYRAELFKQQVDKLKNKIKASNPADIELIPTHLKQYAEDMIDKWIDNAMYAKYQCTENEQYVIKNRNNEDIIVPVDYQNTGVTLKNTIWSNGLHQFVQLKHNLHLTSESLTSSFISNIGYIKLYNNNILGLTGTLGSIAEQKLLSTVYDVDYARIPTFKRKNFEEIGGIVVKNDQWINCIALYSLILTYQGRSVLIICKTIKDLQDLEKNIKALKKLEGFDNLKIKTYPDEDSSNIVDKEVDVSEIIISTNIAGRGTDFKTSLELEQKGGLHVCTSFLPVNQRVEDQAFGRTSRQGKAGTAQLIIKESDVLELGVEIIPEMSFETIKKKRNEIENLRLEKVKNEELSEIAFQDSIFSKFSDLYKGFKQKQMQNPGRLFVIRDLKEYWAFWLRKKNFKNFDLNEVEREFQSFKQAARNILEGNITHNPYYSILQAEHLLSNGQADLAKTALNHAMDLSKEHAELLYSAHIKLFEVAIETGKQIRERFEAAVKKVIFIPGVEKNEAYKDEAKYALEAAKKALEKEIHYIEKHFIGKKSKVQNSDASERVLPDNLDFINISKHGDDNLLVKHIVSRLTVLNVFYQHTESLLNQIKDSLEKDENPGLAINTRIPNYLMKLDPKTTNEQELKKTITDAELSELGLIGLETIYVLREVYDVPKEVIARAQVQIVGGLSVLAMGVAVPLSMPTMGPIAGTLISEGICDIVIELISQGRTQFNERAYIKGKCISYGIAVATMGIAAMAKSTKILDRAIKACKGLANTLRKCPHFTWVCNKLAKQVDKLCKYLEKSKHLVEQLRKLEKLKSTGNLHKLNHLVGVEHLIDLGKLEITLSRCQILTKELVKIGKGTLQGVVGAVIAEKVVTTRLEEILQHLKPIIEKWVKPTIKNRLSEEQLKLVDEKLINEVLIGSYGEISSDILKEVALGIVRHCNNWKAKIASITIDTLITTTEILWYTNKFCKKLEGQLNKNKHDSNSNISDNSDTVIAFITMQVTEQIYGLITRLVGKYAHTFVVNPIMHKVWNSCGVADQKEEFSLDHETVNSFYEIVDDLETLGLKPGASINEFMEASRVKLLVNNPDRNKSDPEANSKYARIVLARQRLTKLYNSHNSAKQNVVRLALPNYDHSQQFSRDIFGHEEAQIGNIHTLSESTNNSIPPSKPLALPNYNYNQQFSRDIVGKDVGHEEAHIGNIHTLSESTNNSTPPSKPLALPNYNHSQQFSRDIIGKDVGHEETHIGNIDTLGESTNNSIPPSKPLALPNYNYNQQFSRGKDVGIEEAHIGNIHTISKFTNQCIIVISQETGELIQKFGEEFKDKAPMVICYSSPQEEKPGHYSIPEEVIKSLKEKNINVLVFEPSCGSDCLYDALVPQYHAQGINISVQGLRQIAQQYTPESCFYGVLVIASQKFNNPTTRAMFLNVQRSLMVGGRMPLKEKNYPSHENRIVASNELRTVLAALRNELNKLMQRMEDFNSMSEANRRRYIEHNKCVPCFGTVPDKEEMMMGALEVKFTNGSSLQLVTVSGNTPFFSTSRITGCRDLNFTDEPVLLEWNYKGFKFVDPGMRTDYICDVYNMQETTEKYSKSCAAQKLLYELSEYMKQNPRLKIKGEIKMAEAWYKPANKGKISAEQVELQASCRYCEKVLPIATGQNFTGNG